MKGLFQFTNKWAIMTIFIMISISSFLSANNFMRENTSDHFKESGLKTLYYWSNNQTSQEFIIRKNTYISENTNTDLRNPLILLTLQNIEIYRSTKVIAENLRDEEKTYYSYEEFVF